MSFVVLAFTVLLVEIPSALAEQQPDRAASRELRQTQGRDSERTPTGSIGGVVVDSSGAAVPAAQVTFLRESESVARVTISDAAGRFSFPDAIPGAFQLTVAVEGFAAKTYSGTLQAGETLSVPPIELAVASASSQVLVLLSPAEQAAAEVKDQEKQRVLGVLPNFYVTYNGAAVPLSRKEKFELAWKSSIDPVTFGVTAAIAGIEQGTNAFPEYGQGARGYANRFGAAYADFVAGTFIGSAILPSLLKQDPRYFYKGTGSVRSRIRYAVANAVICKGDSGRWEANYSAIGGGLAAGAISNLYYPASSREGVGLTFENAAIAIGATAATNLLQEFVIKRLTPHAPNYSPPAQP